MESYVKDGSKNFLLVLSVKYFLPWPVIKDFLPKEIEEV